jgi:lipopolysaccharide export system permease protein
LLHPPNELNERQRAAFLAEAHNRITAPLYCIAFALIALVATGKGPMTRGGYALRLTIAALIGTCLRLMGYAAQGLAARNTALMFLLYLLPILGTVMAMFALAEIRAPALLQLSARPRPDGHPA